MLRFAVYINWTIVASVIAFIALGKLTDTASRYILSATSIWLGMIELILARWDRKNNGDNLTLAVSCTVAAFLIIFGTFIFFRP